VESKRPHKWPCVCQDCCAPFDPNMDFTGEPGVFRADKSKPVPDGMPLAEFLREIMRMACKATGKTEEQLKAMARQMGDPFREWKAEPARHWTDDDDEREPGEEG